MNGKLILRAAAIGVLISFAVIVSSFLFIFFVAPQWSNYVFEDYIIILVLLGLFPVAIYAFKKASSRKILHAVAVYFLSLFLLVLIIVLICLALWLAITIYCRTAGCRFFPL